MRVNAVVMTGRSLLCALFLGSVLALHADDFDKIDEIMLNARTYATSAPIKIIYTSAKRHYYQAEHTGERLPDGRIEVKNPRVLVGDGVNMKPATKIVRFSEELQQPYQDMLSTFTLITQDQRYSFKWEWDSEVAAGTTQTTRQSNCIFVTYNGEQKRVLYTFRLDSGVARHYGNKTGSESSLGLRVYRPSQPYSVRGGRFQAGLVTFNSERSGDKLIAKGGGVEYHLLPSKGHMISRFEENPRSGKAVLEYDDPVKVGAIDLPTRIKDAIYYEDGQPRMVNELRVLSYEILSPGDFESALQLEFPPDTDFGGHPTIGPFTR